MKPQPLLDEMQRLLAAINDVPVSVPVSAFHLAERAHCAALLGRELGRHEDEQLLIREDGDEAALSVYIDASVLSRLTRQDPLTALREDNLADFCTAVEGVSHFQYLVWCLAFGRQLSLLEIELQADVDKYSLASCLLRRQGRTDLPRGLCRRLFDEVALVPGLSAEQRQRYLEANRHAARFCRGLDRRFLCSRHFRPEGWLRQLREFYRRPHHSKLRFALQ